MDENNFYLLENSYFLHLNFDEKSCFAVFLHEWKRVKKATIQLLEDKVSVQNVIFSNEMEKYSRNGTYFSIEFGKNIGT